MINLAVMSLMMAASVPQVAERPDIFLVSEERTGPWQGQIESRVAWDGQEPYLDEAICTLKNGPLAILLTRGRDRHDARSPEILFDRAAIAGDGEITSLAIGKREFQLEGRDWSFYPWFSNFDYARETFIAGGGDYYLMFREGKHSPLLPGGLLLGPMLNSKKLGIHYRRDTDDSAPAKDEQLEMDISRLNEALGWCVEGLADDQSILTLPKALSNRSR